MPVAYPMLPYVGPTLWCPTPLYVGDLPYTNNLPNSKYILNSEFLVCLQVISSCDPLCTFAEPSGAWEVPS